MPELIQIVFALLRRSGATSERNATNKLLVSGRIARLYKVPEGEVEKVIDSLVTQGQLSEKEGRVWI